MTLPISGKMSHSMIMGEFGEASPFSLSANGGPLIEYPSGAPKVKESDFYGASATVDSDGGPPPPPPPPPDPDPDEIIGNGTGIGAFTYEPGGYDQYVSETQHASNQMAVWQNPPGLQGATTRSYSSSFLVDPLTDFIFEASDTVQITYVLAWTVMSTQGVGDYRYYATRARESIRYGYLYWARGGSMNPYRFENTIPHVSLPGGGSTFGTPHPVKTEIARIGNNADASASWYNNTNGKNYLSVKNGDYMTIPAGNLPPEQFGASTGSVGFLMDFTCVYDPNNVYASVVLGHLNPGWVLEVRKV